MADHLLRRCPPFFLHHLLLSWRLLRHPRVLPLLTRDPTGTTLHAGTEVRTPQLRVGLHTGLSDPAGPPTPSPSVLQLKLTGEWRVISEDSRRPPLLASHRQEVYADHLEALGQPPPTLPMALSSAPTLWPPDMTPLPQGPRGPPLPVNHSVTLGWLLRRCRAWQLVARSPPCVPLPPAPPPAVAPALVVCALGCGKHDALDLLRQVPDDAALVILATATVVDHLQPHCHEPLTLLPLPEGLMVGRALGAPLNTTDWPEQM